MQESEIQENQETEYLDLTEEEQEQDFKMDFGMVFNYEMPDTFFWGEGAFDIGDLGFNL